MIMKVKSCPDVDDANAAQCYWRINLCRARLSMSTLCAALIAVSTQTLGFGKYVEISTSSGD